MKEYCEHCNEPRTRLRCVANEKPKRVGLARVMADKTCSQASRERSWIKEHRKLEEAPEDRA